MSNAEAPQNLFCGATGRGIPLLMGGAAFYFTSGGTLRCDRNQAGHASCTESRGVLKELIDIRYAITRRCSVLKRRDSNAHLSTLAPLHVCRGVLVSAIERKVAISGRQTVSWY
jgi:hypothetical protein